MSGGDIVRWSCPAIPVIETMAACCIEKWQRKVNESSVVHNRNTKRQVGALERGFSNVGGTKIFIEKAGNERAVWKERARRSMVQTRFECPSSSNFNERIPSLTQPMSSRWRRKV